MRAINKGDPEKEGKKSFAGHGLGTDKGVSNPTTRGGRKEKNKAVVSQKEKFQEIGKKGSSVMTITQSGLES